MANSSSARLIQYDVDTSRAGGAYTLTADGIFEMTLTRQASQSTICETRNLTGQADPVLHVLARPAGDGDVTELARDDDSGAGLNARLSFTAPDAGNYLLIMRAAGVGASGTADLFCDGKPIWSGINVGGAFKRLEQLNRKESLRTVTLTGGPQLHTLYLLDNSGGLVSRSVSGPADSTFVDGGLEGMRNAMVGARWPDPAGEIRLIRNDSQLAGHDPDEDGLGRDLEAAIGTCSSSSGLAGDFDCARAADPRDTDGDGLGDAVELAGRLDLEPYQHLPRWGADPRHKDVFIEVDYGMRAKDDLPQKMKPEEALNFMRIFADPEFDPVLRVLHAQILDNPDGKPGISTHLDIGVAPPAGTARFLAVSYGDWGGHNVAPPDCDASGCRPQAASSVWKTMMAPSRRGLFHYALGDPGEGGQAGFNTIALNLPMGNAVAAAHEFGHTLGIDHGGTTPGLNCMPNYPSLMNYGYYRQQVPQRFSDGFARRALNNVALGEHGAVANPSWGQSVRYLSHLEKVYGLTVDPQLGHVDWNRDGVYSDSTVRGFANLQPTAVGGCEATRDGQMKAGGTSRAAPALVRLGQTTILIYVDENFRLRVETVRGALRCPKLGQSCGSLIALQGVIPLPAAITAVDAHPLTDPQRMLVVYRLGTALFETSFRLIPTFTGFSAIWATPKRITAASQGEFSVAGTGDRAWLAFRGRDDAIFLKARTQSGLWTSDEIIQSQAGVPIGPVPGDSAPAILVATRADGEKVLLGAFPAGPVGALYVYERTLQPASWRLIHGPVGVDPVTARPEPIVGKPAIAFEPTRPESPLPGRIHLLYIPRAQSGPTVVKQAFLAARNVGPNPKVEFLTALHDNDWLYAKGVDLLFEPGVDTNLRAAVATVLIEDGKLVPGRVWVRPKADGIVDFNQRSFNDWAKLGHGLCSTLRQSGANVTCAPAP